MEPYQSFLRTSSTKITFHFFVVSYREEINSKTLNYLNLLLLLLSVCSKQLTFHSFVVKSLWCLLVSSSAMNLIFVGHRSEVVSSKSNASLRQELLNECMLISSTLYVDKEVFIFCSFDAENKKSSSKYCAKLYPWVSFCTPSQVKRAFDNFKCPKTISTFKLAEFDRNISSSSSMSDGLTLYCFCSDKESWHTKLLNNSKYCWHWSNTL